MENDNPPKTRCWACRWLYSNEVGQDACYREHDWEGLLNLLQDPEAGPHEIWGFLLKNNLELAYFRLQDFVDQIKSRTPEAIKAEWFPCPLHYGAICKDYQEEVPSALEYSPCLNCGKIHPEYTEFCPDCGQLYIPDIPTYGED